MVASEAASSCVIHVYSCTATQLCFFLSMQKTPRGSFWNSHTVLKKRGPQVLSACWEKWSCTCTYMQTQLKRASKATKGALEKKNETTLLIWKRWFVCIPACSKPVCWRACIHNLWKIITIYCWKDVKERSLVACLQAFSKNRGIKTILKKSFQLLSTLLKVFAFYIYLIKAPRIPS